MVRIDCDLSKVSDGFHTMQDLYEHRVALFIALMESNPGISWKYRDFENDEWVLGGMNLKTGPIAYPLPGEVFDNLAVGSRIEPPEYDGYTPDDILRRLSDTDWVNP